MRKQVLCLGVGITLSSLFLPPTVCAQKEEPKLTVEQQTQFLLKARVIKNKTLAKGITAPQRLTMKNTRVTIITDTLRL